MPFTKINYQLMLLGIFVIKGEMIIGKTTPSIDLETNFDSITAYTLS